MTWLQGVLALLALFPTKMLHNLNHPVALFPPIIFISSYTN